MHTAVNTVTPMSTWSMNLVELNDEPPEVLWAHVSKPALREGANFITLMKHLASSGLCPNFTAWRPSHQVACTIFM